MKCRFKVIENCTPVRIVHKLLAGLMFISGSQGIISKEYCNKIQFNFDQPQLALAEFKECAEALPMLSNDLYQRLVYGWARFAAETSVGNALKLLEDPDIREILLQGDEWIELMSRAVEKHDTNSSSSEVFKPIFIIEIALVGLISILIAGATVWLLKLKAAIQLMIINEETEDFSPQNGFYPWEPESEILLQPDPNCQDFQPMGSQF